MTTETSATFSNLENGVHAFTVEAIDDAGNVSEPATVMLNLNRFKAFTAIYAVLSTTDDAGNVQLTLRGKGFITNGAVQSVFLSQKGSPPLIGSTRRERAGSPW